MVKIHFVALSNNNHGNIIFKQLYSIGFLNEVEGVLITDNTVGKNVEFCRNQGMKVICVDKEDMGTSLLEIQNSSPEYLFCFGWDRKLPTSYLNLFKKSVNFHSGLLPDYRGAQPYMHVYANISDEYGVTAHYMTAELDDGAIILQRKFKLFLDEEPEIIYQRCAELVAFIVPDVLRLVVNNYPGHIQKGVARYFYKLSREEMDNYRQKNIEHIRKGEPIEYTPHRAWIL